MAEKTKARTKKVVKKRVRKTAVPKKTVAKEGLNMDDLVGTISITVDPLVYQRSIRDEW